MISIVRKVVLQKHLINFLYRQDIVGQVFFTNDTILNENEVTLTDDLILNICMKGQLSQIRHKRSFFN